MTVERVTLDARAMFPAQVQVRNGGRWDTPRAFPGDASGSCQAAVDAEAMARKYPDRRVRVLTYRGWDEIWHLTLAQAEAVYDAMIALNDVSGRVQATIPIGDGADLRVFEKESGEVHVVLVAEHIAQKWRVYDDQHAFAVAHGLEDK